MNKNLLISILILPVVAIPLVLAQTIDGDAGATSKGQLDLDLQVLDNVQISSLDTIDFGTYGSNDTGALNFGDAYCVYVNGGDQYTITPTSVNTAFKLVGSAFGDEIVYSVKLGGSATGAASATPTAYSTVSDTFQGSLFLDCNLTNNASINLSIDEQAIRNATTDLYQDTLILLVNPI